MNLDSVRGANVASWSVRNLSGQENLEPVEARQLIIQLKKPIESGAVDCVITATGELEQLPAKQRPLFFSTVKAGFLSGGMGIIGNGVLVEPVAAAGLLLLDRSAANQFHYRFDGDRPGLNLELSHLRRPPLNFTNFDLKGIYSEGSLRFTLTGTLEALYDQKYRVPLLSGLAALTKAPQIKGAEVALDREGYWLELEEAGTYAVELEFEALIRTGNGTSRVEFDLIDAPLQPVQLSGMPVSKERVRLNDAPLQAEGEALVGSLAGNGVFGMRWTDPSWKNPQAAEASLIYATRNIAQVAVGNGLIRQRNDLDVQIMQGSMKALSFDLKGQGEVTRVGKRRDPQLETHGECPPA